MTRKVKISELKARLSEHLRHVRRGHTITVMDRDTPVAEIVQPDWARTAPSTGSYSVTLNSGDTASNKDFANTQLVSISGKKYKDLTGNGITSDDTALGDLTRERRTRAAIDLAWNALAAEVAAAADRAPDFSELIRRSGPNQE